VIAPDGKLIKQVDLGAPLIPGIEPDRATADRAIPDGERRLRHVGFFFEVVIAMRITVALPHRIRAIDMAIDQNLASIPALLKGVLGLWLTHVRSIDKSAATNMNLRERGFQVTH
jgi:hypothetical protein